jgi:hypothetical protein
MIDAHIRAIWEEEYAFARDSGFEPDRAARIAGEATALRKNGNRGARLAKTRPSTEPPGEIPGDPSQAVVMLENGSFSRLADCDDSHGYEAIDETQSWHFAVSADHILTDIMEAETGMVVSQEKYAKRLEEKDRLRNQAIDICNALERVGVPMRRSDGWSMWRYTVHSDTLDELPAYRRVCINPYVAAMLRAPKLSALEYFLSLCQPWQCRFWTFTSGRRCRHHELNARCRWMHRRLSKLNALLKKRGFPVAFVFRATEFGGLERTENGVQCGGEIQRKGRHVFYHPHMHTVLFVREFMSEGRWQLLLSVVRDFWKHHFDAGKMVKNARECVKYITKPGDMVKLARSNPRELTRVPQFEKYDC